MHQGGLRDLPVAETREDGETERWGATWPAGSPRTSEHDRPRRRVFRVQAPYSFSSSSDSSSSSSSLLLLDRPAKLRRARSPRQAPRPSPPRSHRPPPQTS